MNFTESRLRNIIRESINNLILTESQESKSISAAKKLVIQRLGYDEQQADKFVRIDLRQDIPSLRTPQGGKFILGVTRMFCDGELDDATTIGNLNTTLKYVASDAHINEYDRDLNGMSAKDLIDRFAQNIEMDLENDKNKIDSMQFDGVSDYQIVRIDSFEQAQEYGDYTDWCVTHDKDMFDSYTNGGFNQFYFCLKNGFEQVPEEEGEGCPLDEYGLSMIAVCVNDSGGLSTCTCRWNHDNDGNDNIMTTEEISNVIHMGFYKVFKPNNKWRDAVNGAMQRLANGEDPEYIFDLFMGFSEGFARVKLGKKWNFITQDGGFLSPNQWFNSCDKFRDGFAKVILGGKRNFINQNGEIVSKNQWFDECYYFREGFALVKLNRKWNHLSQNGELLSDQWFDSCGNFCNGFAVVKLNRKANFINQDGELLSKQWFDWCNDFCEGFAIIAFGRKYNFINQNGELLWKKPIEEWFDWFGNFRDGFARIRLNGEYCYIDKNGNITMERPQVSESLIRNVIRECVMDFIKMNK